MGVPRDLEAKATKATHHDVMMAGLDTSSSLGVRTCGQVFVSLSLHHHNPTQQRRQPAEVVACFATTRSVRVPTTGKKSLPDPQGRPGRIAQMSADDKQRQVSR